MSGAGKYCCAGGGSNYFPDAGASTTLGIGIGSGSSLGQIFGMTAEVKTGSTVAVASGQRHDWALRSDAFVATGRRLMFCNGRFAR